VRSVSSVVAFLLVFATAGHAQSFERFTVDSVIEADVFGGQNVSNRPQAIVDISAAVRLGGGWQLVARPWIRQARPTTPGGAVPQLDVEMYEALARYERAGAVSIRFDVGEIYSPIGIGIFDWRPSANPTIVPHLSYAVPLVGFDPTVTVTESVVANTYPIGAQLNASTRTWDARAAVINSSPTRQYYVGGSSNPSQAANVVFGAGVTPVTGLRFGTSFGYGTYATRDELAPGATDDRHATIAGVEGEYAFAYTSLRGEIMHTSFETATGSAAATEWFVQGTQILSPRWFAAARFEQSSGPPVTLRGQAIQTDLNMFEGTAGFRISPEFTLRTSYYARRFYRATTWDNQAGVSLVWARRWW